MIELATQNGHLSFTMGSVYFGLGLLWLISRKGTTSLKGFVQGFRSPFSQTKHHFSQQKKVEQQVMLHQTFLFEKGRV